MRKAARASLPRSASIPQKQMQQPMNAAPTGGLYDMGSWPLSLSAAPSGSLASASTNMLGLTGSNVAGLQRLLQQQGQQRLAVSTLLDLVPHLATCFCCRLQRSSCSRLCLALCRGWWDDRCMSRSALDHVEHVFM